MSPFTNDQYIQLTRQLQRIGAVGLDFMTDDYGAPSLADESAYYPLTKSYQACLSLLSSFDDDAIGDLSYDGEDRDIWQVIWSLTT